MDGIRTVKTNGSTIHHYTLNGSQIVTETWTTKSSSGAETPNHFLVYLYDENGAPIGLQYRNKTYGTYTFDTYYFEKNLQGDIVAIYTEEGTKKGLRNRVLNRRLFLCVTAQSSRVLPFSNHRSIIYSNELHRSNRE